jgi:hypothetical protein
MDMCLYSCLSYWQQIAFLLRRIILLSVACLALTYFSTLSQKRQDFGEKFYEKEMCGLIFYANVSETFLILKSI